MRDWINEGAEPEEATVAIEYATLWRWVKWLENGRGEEVKRELEDVLLDGIEEGERPLPDELPY